MASFLGVPIRIREEIFGNLYLAESTKGALTADDEEFAKALAASAAAAIENARLYEAAQQRQDWLHASAAITQHCWPPTPLIRCRCWPPSPARSPTPTSSPSCAP